MGLGKGQDMGLGKGQEDMGLGKGQGWSPGAAMPLGSVLRCQDADVSPETSPNARRLLHFLGRSASPHAQPVTKSPDATADPIATGLPALVLLRSRLADLQTEPEMKAAGQRVAGSSGAAADHVATRLPGQGVWECGRCGLRAIDADIDVPCRPPAPEEWPHGPWLLRIPAGGLFSWEAALGEAMHSLMHALQTPASAGSDAQGVTGPPVAHPSLRSLPALRSASESVLGTAHWVPITLRSMQLDHWLQLALHYAPHRLPSAATTGAWTNGRAARATASAPGLILDGTLSASAPGLFSEAAQAASALLLATLQRESGVSFRDVPGLFSEVCRRLENDLTRQCVSGYAAQAWDSLVDAAAAIVAWHPMAGVVAEHTRRLVKRMGEIRRRAAEEFGPAAEEVECIRLLAAELAATCPSVGRVAGLETELGVVQI
jgi:hypothetical protein